MSSSGSICHARQEWRIHKVVNWLGAAAWSATTCGNTLWTFQWSTALGLWWRWDAKTAPLLCSSTLALHETEEYSTRASENHSWGLFTALRRYAPGRRKHRKAGAGHVFCKCEGWKLEFKHARCAGLGSERGWAFRWLGPDRSSSGGAEGCGCVPKSLQQGRTWYVQGDSTDVSEWKDWSSREGVVQTQHATCDMFPKQPSRSATRTGYLGHGDQDQVMTPVVVKRHLYNLKGSCSRVNLE